MHKLKIIDFDYGCGGFTKGLEDTGKFQVTRNLSLNNNNFRCYSNTHKNNFDLDDDMNDDYDIITYTPHLGNGLARRGGGKFRKNEVNNLLLFVSFKKPQNIIIITKRDAFPYLQYSDKVCRINNNTPSKDIICNFLSDIGYSVYFFVLDEAGFGLPQHVYYNIYWASLNDVGSLYIKEGFGRFKQKYRIPKHILSDLKDDTKVSWHKPDYKKRDVCSLIKPGGSARTTSSVSQSNGYNRLMSDKIVSHLSNDFYTVSSGFPSIHPWYDRPLTIREGARLFGLTDDFNWDSRLKNKEVASMIYNGFYPVVSKLIGFKLYKLLK